MQDDQSDPKPFDEAEWRRRLFEFNPWADGLKIDESDEAFVVARKAESLRRYESGKEEWNAWAEGMLALQREAEETGFWNASVFAHHALTRDHLALAEADFKGHPFTDDVDFRAFQFPGRARFIYAEFGNEDAPVEARFSGATFKGWAWFDHATFSNEASFGDATFNDEVSFGDATFEGMARFGEATFKGEARFDDATFNGEAWFLRATFDGTVWFGREKGFGAIFNGMAMFSGATFKKRTFFSSAQFTSMNDRADFRLVIFEGPVKFAGSRFTSRAAFTSIHSKAAFSLAGAEFTHIPDFVGATFHEPPRLDDSVLRNPISESHPFDHGQAPDSAPDPRAPGLLRCCAVACDSREHARLRKLRSMAAAGKDHENELLFNAYEIAARRFWVDKPWSGFVPGGRFWLGWFYGLISDYGRSIMRPLVAWSLVVCLFWGVFFFCTTDFPALGYGTRCHGVASKTKEENGQDKLKARRFTGPGGQALALSFRNALVINRMEPAASRQMYGCLYGFRSAGGLQQPDIPPSVTFLSALQAFLSAILLFLAGLGVRNMFRIK
jgi:uncharacterized protein YjbI with pentapeptide repeats